MGEYFCDCCNRILDDSEIHGIWDEDLNERFIGCSFCGAECSCYDQEEDLDEEDEFDDFEEEEDLDGNEDILGDDD